MGRWLGALSIVLSLGLLGCQTSLPSCEAPAAPIHSDYALVEYHLREESGKAPKVEISDTETYRGAHARYSAAALRLPDSCLNEGAAKVTGVASASQSILQTQCGPWLAEIERALAGAGFRVMSWDAVWKLEREKNLSTYNAAKELGAEIVFVFNSLEAANVTAGSSKLTSHAYFESDERGARGAPLPLDEATRSAFLKYTLDAAGKSVKAEEVIALSSVLDSTAIVTETGESIWFYRRTATLPTQAKQGLRFLFGRAPGGGWTPAAPVTDGTVASEAAPAMKTEESTASTAPAAVNAFDKERLQLIRAGAEHFVEAFKSGELHPEETTETER